MSWSSISDGRLGNSCEREILTEWQSLKMSANFKIELSDIKKLT